MLWWWTPVGALIGGLSAWVVAWLVSWQVPWDSCAALGIVSLAALSGGLHLDGFMDTCDGLGSRAPRERALEIMKDPRAGAFGVVGVVCLLLAKVAALGGVPPERGLQALALAPVAGRVTQVLVLTVFGYARRSEGMGGVFFSAATPLHAVVTVLAALGLSVAIRGGIPLSMLLTAATCLLMAFHVRARLGGHTGDTVGALSEVAECLYLLACLPAALH